MIYDGRFVSVILSFAGIHRAKLTNETPSAVVGARRLIGLDLARFVALVGMVIVNFDVVMVTRGIDQEASGIASWLAGRAAATFVVLAGIGIGLGATSKPWRQTYATNLKRVLFLLVLGLGNSLIFSADIIHYYAIYFLFAIVFLRAPSWMLWGTIASLIIGFVLLVLTLEYDTGWNWQAFEYDGFWTPSGFVRNLFFNGWHPVVPWFSFVLYGIWLSRLDLQNRSIQRKLLAGGCISFVSVTLLSGWLMQSMSRIDEGAAILFATDPVPPMPLYLIAGGSAASLAIGACLLIEPRVQSTRAHTMMIAAGRQTLTLYIAHILVGMGLLESLGMIGGQTAATAVTVSVIFCVAATLFAWGWSRKFERGPLEWLMRRLTG